MDVPQNLTVKQTRFLRCYEASASVTEAARWAKISRRTHYDWLEESPSYVKAFERAEGVAAKALEDEAVKRAHRGIRKPVWYKGKVVGYEQEYSDSLMALLLKGAIPSKYRDNARVEMTGKDGAPLNVAPTNSPEIISAIMKELADVPQEARSRLAQRLLAINGPSQ